MTITIFLATLALGLLPIFLAIYFEPQIRERITIPVDRD